MDATPVDAADDAVDEEGLEEGAPLNDTKAAGFHDPDDELIPLPGKGPDILRVVDSLLALHVVAPLVIASWRGLFEMFQLYPAIPNWALATFGVVLHSLLALSRDVFMTTFDCRRYPEPTRNFVKVLTRFYTYVFMLSCVSHWRGLWFLLDLLGTSGPAVAAVWAMAAASLFALRSWRNTMAPPLVVAQDGPDHVFSFSLRFRADSSRQTLLYVLDCMFSVLVVHTLVVFVWRGAWCMFDIYLYPRHYAWSAWGSLTLGYCITIVAFSLQPCMMSVVQRMSGCCRVLVVDMYHMFSFLGTVNVWRGVWNLLNHYFLPGNPVASYWISHLLPFLLLVLLNCANSSLVRGVYIDAEEEGGQCVEFPIYYLRLFFQNRRRKKLMRQHALGKRPSGGSSTHKSTLLDNNHQQNHSPSPPSSRKSSKEQPLQPCLSHGLSHGMSHPHHHNLRVQLPPLAPQQGQQYKDIPESPV